MIGNVEKRCIDLGHYIIETGATVRQAGIVFGISKSTVHNDVTKRLAMINPLLCSEVKAVLEQNKAESTKSFYISDGGEQETIIKGDVNRNGDDRRKRRHDKPRDKPDQDKFNARIIP